MNSDKLRIGPFVLHFSVFGNSQTSSAKSSRPTFSELCSAIQSRAHRGKTRQTTLRTMVSLGWFPAWWFALSLWVLICRNLYPVQKLQQSQFSTHQGPHLNKTKQRRKNKKQKTSKAQNTVMQVYFLFLWHRNVIIFYYDCLWGSDETFFFFLIFPWRLDKSPFSKSMVAWC